jgi:nitroreductase
MKLLKTRYSIRKYKQETVAKELIHNIVEAMLSSPSGKNKNPWEFLCLDNKEIISGLSRAKSGGAKFLESTPNVIVVLSQEEKSDTWIEDASIALTIGHLTAHELGLGSCWIQIRNRENADGPSIDYIREYLNLPDGLNVVGLLSIGYPDEQPDRVKKYDYSKVHYNKYGVSNE